MDQAERERTTSLAQRALERLRAGDRPGAEALLASDPELAAGRLAALVAASGSERSALAEALAADLGSSGAVVVELARALGEGSATLPSSDPSPVTDGDPLDRTEDLPRTRPAPAPPDQPLFDGRYREVRLLGAGGFGRVLLVEDTLHENRRLALKTLLPSRQADDQFERRFRKEIQILRALAHPGIPQIFNDGRTAAGEFYFTMDFVEGQPFSKVLRDQGSLESTRVARVLRQIVEVLVYAHGRGVVHRDLKPDNILLVDEGESERVLVLDFGIAKIVGSAEELQSALTMQTAAPIGTPHYMSPEQIQNKDIDGSTDIYALGVLIYQLLSGSFPFKGTTYFELASAICEGRPEPLSARLEPAWARVLVPELIAREKDRRPTAEQLLERLDAILGGETIRPTPAPGRDRRRWVAAASVVALAAVVTVALRALGGGADEGGEDPRSSSLGAVPATSGEDPGGDGEGGSPTDGVPRVALDEPVGGAPTAASELTFAGRLSPPAESITVDGREVEVDPSSGRFEVTVAVAEGAREIELRTADGRLIESFPVRVDRTDPRFADLTVDGSAVDTTRPLVTASDRVMVRGALVEEGSSEGLELSIGGVAVSPDADGRFEQRATVGDGRDGTFDLALVARDGAGNEQTASIAVTVDRVAPSLVGLPAEELVETTEPELVLTFEAHDPHLAQVFVDGEAVAVGADGAVRVPIRLALDEERTVRIVAVDSVENDVARTLRVRRNDLPPLALEGLALEGDGLGAPLGPWEAPFDADRVTLRGRIDGDAIRATANGAEGRVDGSTFEFDLPLETGPNEVELTVTDARGASGSERVTIRRLAGRPVPDGWTPAEGDVAESGYPLRLRHGATGLEFAYVAPGRAQGEFGLIDLATGYYLSTTEVSREVYLAFVDATGRAAPRAPSGTPAPADPVVYVTVDDARAMADWAGLALSTVDQLRWAAIGPAGNAYPFGATWDEAACNAKGEADGFAGVAPVTAFFDRRSWCGVLNLSGNVAEWCLDADGEPALFGGSFQEGPERCRPAALTGFLPQQSPAIGFRLAAPLF